MNMDNMGHEVENHVEDAKQEVKNRAEDASQEMNEMGRELRQRANDIRKEAVKQMNAAADSIRKEAHDSTDNPDAHKAADEVAKGLEKTAHYLNDHSVEDMGAEATKVVRSNPLRVVFVTFVVGLIIGIMMRGNDKH